MFPSLLAAQLRLHLRSRFPNRRMFGQARERPCVCMCGMEYAYEKCGWQLRQVVAYRSYRTCTACSTRAATKTHTHAHMRTNVRKVHIPARTRGQSPRAHRAARTH
eukprot:568660-Pleurochrysis_carterae.AAC.1